MDKTELIEYLGRDDGFDEIRVQPLRTLCAMLDLPIRNWMDGDPIPPAWQWLYFLPETPQSRLEADGHPPRGSSLPVPPAARRLFAGARMTFHRPLRVGTRVYRESSVADVARKQGRGGALVFLTVRYLYRDDRGPLLAEEQDIVFSESVRVAADAGNAVEVPSAQWNRGVTPDPVMLFRFSALTFNAHRIHYDLGYARQQGYPGLLTHGPLIAILLLDLAARNAPHKKVDAFNFRATAPVYAGTPIAL
ncbi:MAG: MaoC family dehydratase N-terminal domain-containing protein, partial [Gammaproteobacteria bacterium]|nr:MaoC family dehydratase N-terminal domain-containing protein [Gammaproteobacteria bacterium]